MKWTFVIQQKFKVILLLTTMIVLIGLTNYLEQRNIDEMDESFNSIYFDRLVPATEIFHLTQNLYNQRILLEVALNGDEKVTHALGDALDTLTANTHDRIQKFEKTFLVQHESYALVTFKHRIHEYEAIESNIVRKLITGDREDAMALYHARLQPKFTQTLHTLEDLSSIQTSVGMDILKASRSTISNSNLVLTLQIITAVVIGLMTHALIIASRTANIENKNFHLN